MDFFITLQLSPDINSQDKFLKTWCPFGATIFVYILVQHFPSSDITISWTRAQLFLQLTNGDDDFTGPMERFSLLVNERNETQHTCKYFSSCRPIRLQTVVNLRRQRHSLNVPVTGLGPNSYTTTAGRRTTWTTPLTISCPVICNGLKYTPMIAEAEDQRATTAELHNNLTATLWESTNSDTQTTLYRGFTAVHQRSN